jgi:ADP-ribose pyrophosphatase YjhB (NUDIX family)
MIISASGIVVDHYGDVVLIRRDDTRTLAPPGGAANLGELPPDTVAREVREETGLIVMPVRLVGLYYLPTWPDNFLTLVFRCIMRGGEIETSEESPQVGFFKTDPLPKPMLDIHARRIKQATSHTGGPPTWETNQLSLAVRLGNRLMHGVIYPWLHARRRRAGLPEYEPPPDWHARSLVVLRNEQGQVLWVKDRQTQEWVLPGGASATEPPWATASQALLDWTGRKASLVTLSGIYPALDSPEMTFAFTADSGGEKLETHQGETAYFAPGKEPLECWQDHVSVAAEAVRDDGEVVFRQLGAQTK